MHIELIYRRPLFIFLNKAMGNVIFFCSMYQVKPLAEDDNSCWRTSRHSARCWHLRTEPLLANNCATSRFTDVTIAKPSNADCHACISEALMHETTIEGFWSIGQQHQYMTSQLNSACYVDSWVDCKQLTVNAIVVIIIKLSVLTTVGLDVDIVLEWRGVYLICLIVFLPQLRAWTNFQRGF